MNSVGEERSILLLFCYRILIILLFLIEGVSSSSGLGNAASFYCGTPWVFHMIR